MAKLTFGCGVLLVVAACQSSASPNNAPPPAVAPSSPATPAPTVANAANAATLTVSAALNQLPDSAVQLSGLYLGWNGPCTGKPPTRSAWHLAESNAPNAPCIYVDGPAVPDAPANAPPPNLTVVVRGKLVVDGNLRYIKADSVEKP
jgi:hypothetical protein